MSLATCSGRNKNYEAAYRAFNGSLAKGETIIY